MSELQLARMARVRSRHGVEALLEAAEMHARAGEWREAAQVAQAALEAAQAVRDEALTATSWGARQFARAAAGAIERERYERDEGRLRWASLRRWMQGDETEDLATVCATRRELEEWWQIANREHAPHLHHYQTLEDPRPITGRDAGGDLILSLIQRVPPIVLRRSRYLSLWDEVRLGDETGPLLATVKEFGGPLWGTRHGYSVALVSGPVRPLWDFVEVRPFIRRSLECGTLRPVLDAYRRRHGRG